jgi:hypothetical protein
MIDRFLQPQLLLALLLIGMFGWAYSEDVADATMKGALIGAFSGAWGYYLGSSRGATSQTENVSKALDLATSSAPPTDPTVTLKPGETAQAEERP